LTATITAATSVCRCAITFPATTGALAISGARSGDFNFDWNTCHDDHHRDGDGDNHNNDFWG
jgi:hypothetical protein